MTAPHTLPHTVFSTLPRRTGQKFAVLLLAASLAIAHAAAQAQPGRGPDRDRDGHGDDHRGGHRGGHRDSAHDNGRHRGPGGHEQARHAPGRWYDDAHGHNRHHPQPGWAVHGAPSSSRVVVWAGVNYRYLDSVWYAPGRRGYVVVRPPFGVVIAERPAFFSLVTIGAIAYLYANGVYYREYPGGGYEVVPAPAQDLAVAAAVPQTKTFVYPRMNQSAEQRAADEYECHKWAVSQTGFDPTAAATGQRVSAAPAQRENYQRASGACLEGRGYTVR